MKKPLWVFAVSALLALAAYSQQQPASSALATSSAVAGSIAQSLAGSDANSSGLTATAAETRLDGKSWWNYVRVLAADDMEGRETGSPGLRKAQEYVVEQLKHAGLEPAGSKGYYQPVQFVSRQIVESDSSLVLVNN
ncbi:MAG TPA: hypothetical protein VJW55_00655, partial [Candidatus Angelobacter sp.]|nr:hypothetical protein [Candidatus Angelobacter sp.]